MQWHGTPQMLTENTVTEYAHDINLGKNAGKSIKDAIIAEYLTVLYDNPKMTLSKVDSKVKKQITERCNLRSIPGKNKSADDRAIDTAYSTVHKTVARITVTFGPVKYGDREILPAMDTSVLFHDAEFDGLILFETVKRNLKRGQEKRKKLTEERVKVLMEREAMERAETRKREIEEAVAAALAAKQ